MKTLDIPKSVKQVKRLIGFLQFFRNFNPNLNEHILPFYKLLRKNVVFKVTEEILDSFETLKEKLKTTATQTLRLAKPGLHYVIFCDASYHSSGFVLMIEDYVKNEKGEDVKSYAPVSFGSKVFKTAQLKMPIYCKEFLSFCFALETFSHFIWGSEKPVLILTDNKSLTRFCQAKTIPPSLWSYVDRVTTFNIVVAHIPGKANAAADFLSRLQPNSNETVEFKLTDRIPVREVEIDIRAKLPDNTINELFSGEFPDDLLQVVDMNTLITLKQSGNFENASQHQKALATQNEEIQLTRYKQAVPINALQLQNPMDNYPELETSVATLEREQQNDALLSKVTTWLTEGTEPPHNIYSSGEEQKYRKQLPRLIIDNGILKRNYYDHDGTILHKQVCVPKHMLKEILYRIHNSPTGGHLGITRTIAEFRRRFYCPNDIEQIASHIRNCSTCLQLKLVQPT